MSKKRKKTPRSKPVSRETNILLKVSSQRGWLKQVEGLLGFLIRLNGADPKDQGAWVEGNRNYYLTRLMNLLDNCPEGFEGLVHDIKVKLKSLR